jgi:FemAB-related protein (PEP-CTERM system-associated)
VRQKSLLFGDFLVSLPFLNYGGILADSDAVGLAIMRKAIELAESLGVSHIELRESQERTGLPSRTEKVSMQLKLPATTEELGKSLGSKMRSQIRRPLRENPKISVGSIELVDRFYRIFSRNMRDLGTPVYPKSMFVEIMRRFPDESNIVLIEISGRPAAAAFLLHFRDTTEVPWASTNREFNALSVNMLLYWELLNIAIGRGTKVFDFGRSTIHSGTYRFKKQWGAQPVQLCWNYWIKDGGVLPHINPDNPKYSLAISVWKRLPLPFSRLIGPLLVRNLP